MRGHHPHPTMCLASSRFLHAQRVSLLGGLGNLRHFLFLVVSSCAGP